MSQYTTYLAWERGEQPFLDSRYSRRHTWRFDGGQEVPASSSPHIVPLPYSDESAVDPEEALVVALSSCHMLTFLSIAAKRKLRVDRYVDEAVGFLEKGAEGQLWMARVTLRPKVVFSGERLPNRDELLQMHDEAHEECFIANSVKSEVVCEPV